MMLIFERIMVKWEIGEVCDNDYFLGVQCILLNVFFELVYIG